MIKFASTFAAVSLAGACSAFAASPPTSPPVPKHSANRGVRQIASLTPCPMPGRRLIAFNQPGESA